MMQRSGQLKSFNSFDRRFFSKKNSPHVIIAVSALALGVTAGCWKLYSPPAPTQIVKTSMPQKLAAQNPYGKMLVGLGRPQQSAALETPAASQSAQTAAPPAADAADANVVATVTEQPAADAAPAPLPPRRPSELGALASRGLFQQQMRRLARLENTTNVPATTAPADERSIFEKFFGAGESTAPQPLPQPQTSRRRAPAQALAYAGPESGLQSVFSDVTRSAVAPTPPPAPASSAAHAGNQTAIYDISAHTVYLPSGQKLEAHSGLREHLDDPRYVHVRMRGATPPNVYNLTPREALFHGVEALRLTPTGGTTFGRAGLLAHTYMLGPNGDSNGCVSFRDYNAFLQAYKRGEVRRLMVVAHM